MNCAELRETLSNPTTKRIHLIGVAGSGMSGIAALLLGLGHKVSGSDKVDTIEVERLIKKGLVFHCPHSPECVRDADIVIYSSAIKAGNPAFDEAVRLDIPMARRADALAAIMGSKKGVIVCGMHGKTTTSAMAAHVLRAGGFKPSHYVGAEIPILGTNARWDSEGDWFVAEGDESDGTLINYHPHHAIVLNIEPEHLDFYKDINAIDAVYKRLIGQASGHIFYCADDEGARRVCASHPQAVSYGLVENSHYRITSLTTENFQSRFTASKDGKVLGEILLNIPGAHNAVNALAVVALATEIGVPIETIAAALASFRGAKRRFEIIHDTNHQTVVDDYGHHPTEIAATLATARTGRHQRVIAMFQPHRYTRTQALKEEFGKAFAFANHVFVSEIYPASEKPIPGISGQTLVDAMIAAGHASAKYVPEVSRIHEAAASVAQDGDLILSLGAGNIHEAGKRLAQDLTTRDTLLDVMGPGRIKLYEPLSKHTTMRIGGPAQFWVEPESEEGFADLVRYCFDENIPLMVIGRGSNLLVRDGGIPGVVAHLSRGDFQRHELNGLEITAGVGVKFKQISALARSANIAGFEWMEGIPGNLGGGLRMNAGAMGIQTFDQIVRIRFCDQDGNIFTRTPAEIDVHYRSVPMLRTNYALSAVVVGRPGAESDIDAAIAESFTKRRSSQPIAASAGCIFKNPDSIPAGKLIEELGLKNFSVGGARVSEIHGNFIVNDGDATSADVLTLIKEIQSAAERTRGIQLDTEVQIVGVDL
jgi:UDP-N-acetylmuramate--L-alanine ligase/UDP-N-acetylenolpyruvoylglucosamine reductase